MGITEKVKKAAGKVSGKSKKADKAAAKVSEVTETPKPETPPEVKPEVKPDKKTAILPDGTQIAVRAGFRAGYAMGNVGWQEFLANMRLFLNCAYYLIKIGADDALVEKYVAKAKAEGDKLDILKVKIPSDMVTQLYTLEHREEAAIGSDAYIKAIRKLSELSKRVAEDRGAILNEVTSAKGMLAKANS